MSGVVCGAESSQSPFFARCDRGWAETAGQAVLVVLAPDVAELMEKPDEGTFIGEETGGFTRLAARAEAFVSWRAARSRAVSTFEAHEGQRLLPEGSWQ